MSQILLQFKFHVWPSFHQSYMDQYYEKRSHENISAISFNKVNSEGIWLVCSSFLVLWALRAKCEAFIFWHWSGLNNCGPRTNSSSVNAISSVSWSSMSFWGPFHTCVGWWRKETKSRLCSGLGDSKGELLQKAGL